MSKAAEKKSFDDMVHASDEEPVAGHDAWVREQVESVLKAKSEGRMTYKPLRDIAAKFGFNAR
jgi:hypothetical protein